MRFQSTFRTTVLQSVLLNVLTRFEKALYAVFYLGLHCLPKAHLTLKAPRKSANENVVCWSHLLQIIA